MAPLNPPSQKMGVAVEISFLSGQGVKLEGVADLPPLPPLSALQNPVRCPRINSALCGVHTGVLSVGQSDRRSVGQFDGLSVGLSDGPSVGQYHRVNTRCPPCVRRTVRRMSVALSVGRSAGRYHRVNTRCPTCVRRSVRLCAMSDFFNMLELSNIRRTQSRTGPRAGHV